MGKGYYVSNSNSRLISVYLSEDLYNKLDKDNISKCIRKLIAGQGSIITLEDKIRMCFDLFKDRSVIRKEYPDEYKKYMRQLIKENKEKYKDRLHEITEDTSTLKEILKQGINNNGYYSFRCIYLAHLAQRLLNKSIIKSIHEDRPDMKFEWSLEEKENLDGWDYMVKPGKHTIYLSSSS